MVGFVKEQASMTLFQELQRGGQMGKNKFVFLLKTLTR